MELYGHKPYEVLFFVGSVACARIRSYGGGILGAGCVGLMFVDQRDLAFFARVAGLA